MGCCNREGGGGLDIGRVRDLVGMGEKAPRPERVGGEVTLLGVDIQQGWAEFSSTNIIYIFNITKIQLRIYEEWC